MLSAVISMQDEIIRQHFAMSKADLVDHYLKGTEAALSRAHILKTTKLESLQAFVMYLVSSLYVLKKSNMLQHSTDLISSRYAARRFRAPTQP